MPSSVYPCVRSQDVQTLRKAAAAYKKMGTTRQVRQAALKAGGVLLTQMEKMMDGESSLASFRDVTASLRIFSDDNNIVVGVPPGPMVARAEQMNATYQVADVAHDLAKQSKDIEEAFYGALLDVVMQ
jgi:hypothetical protein